MTHTLLTLHAPSSARATPSPASTCGRHVPLPCYLSFFIRVSMLATLFFKPRALVLSTSFVLSPLTCTSLLAVLPSSVPASGSFSGKIFAGVLRCCHPPPLDHPKADQWDTGTWILHRDPYQTWSTLLSYRWPRPCICPRRPASLGSSVCPVGLPKTTSISSFLARTGP